MNINNDTRIHVNTIAMIYLINNELYERTNSGELVRPSDETMARLLYITDKINAKYGDFWPHKRNKRKIECSEMSDEEYMKQWELYADMVDEQVERRDNERKG